MTGPDERPAADAAPEIGSGPGRAPEEANPKRLVIFCDGTWNDPRSPHLTNVARLAKCVRPTGVMETEAATGELCLVEVPQVVFYDEGVGVGDGVSWLTDRLVRLEGGALGRGLDAKIERAYRYIVLNYNPKDEIYVFGFSRGAYTARSLCGLIRKCGVLRRTNYHLTSEALALYRDGSKPWEPKAKNFRRLYSHPVVAGEEDYTDAERDIIEKFRADNEVNREIRVVPPEIRRRGFHIKYLGVWDTVGSLGVPVKWRWLYRRTRGRYQFHDQEASSLIESLRHAVALDEDRRTFDVTSVQNIHELNILWSSANKPKQVRSAIDPDYVPYEDRPYQQRWFPGGHGALGGGNAELGLSSAALLWVAEGAEGAGRALDQVERKKFHGIPTAGLNLDRGDGSELAEAKRRQQPCANWKVGKDGRPLPPGSKDLLGEVGGYARRLGPDTFDEIHESARERWRRDATYRPDGMLRFQGLPELAPPPGPGDEEGPEE